jgi:PTH1 family peptidyl-tRNA hydrolase
MKLIIGLGNPGLAYARNRHNIGFMCLSHLARTQGIRFNKRQGNARTGTGSIGGERVVLARPQTYMNASGASVGQLVDRFHITPADLIVIHDDLDLPTGKIRLRLGGRSAGHKGINSIITRLGSTDFYRLRVGIGRPDIPEGSDKETAMVAYVLSDFNPEERKVIAGAVHEASRAVVCIINEGPEAAMNKYN